MTDKPPKEETPEEVFARTVRNLVNTPPKPHEKKEGREPKPTDDQK